MGLTIRPAEARDIGGIVASRWDDDHGQSREDPSLAAQAQYLAAFRDMQKDPNCALLVGLDGDTLCACLQINIIVGLSYQGIRRALIEDVRVARSHRRAGHGAAMMRAAIAHAKDRGCAMVELFVQQDRSAAHEFYEACGFAGHHRGFRRSIAGMAI